MKEKIRKNVTKIDERENIGRGSELVLERKVSNGERRRRNDKIYQFIDLISFYFHDFMQKSNMQRVQSDKTD